MELNRGVAHGMAFGPAAGLAIVDALDLDDYHLLHAVRGDLFEKLGERDQARAAFERAAAMTRNERERGVLLARASNL